MHTLRFVRAARCALQSIAAVTSETIFLMSTRIFRLRRADALFLFVDIQEKLLPAMFEAERIARTSVLLARVATQMQIPTLVTEQNPTKLGVTIVPLSQAIGEYSRREKMLFSACTLEVWEELKSSARTSIVLCGLETHICITQTALDLREKGCEVFVPHDAVSSRYESDKKAGLARLSSIGAIPCSTEMLIFELLREAGTPDFKALLPHLK